MPMGNNKSVACEILDKEIEKRVNGTEPRVRFVSASNKLLEKMRKLARIVNPEMEWKKKHRDQDSGLLL